MHEQINVSLVGVRYLGADDLDAEITLLNSRLACVRFRGKLCSLLTFYSEEKFRLKMCWALF